VVDRAEDVGSISWLAWDEFGVVERLDSEQIATRFFRVIIPVWPSQSYYVTRTADGEEQRIKIALQLRSVILGYLRLPSWLAALFFAAPAIALPDIWGWMIVPAAVMTIIAALLTFVAGKLDEEEQWRRSLLRRVVGFGAPPEMLAEEMRDEVCTNLERMWHARSPYGSTRSSRASPASSWSRSPSTSRIRHWCVWRGRTSSIASGTDATRPRPNASRQRRSQ
jgi:hypothetical protein